MSARFSVCRQDPVPSQIVLSDIFQWYSNGDCVVLYDSTDEKAGYIFHHCSPKQLTTSSKIQSSVIDLTQNEKDKKGGNTLNDTVCLTSNDEQNFNLIYIDCAKDPTLLDDDEYAKILKANGCKNCECEIGAQVSGLSELKSFPHIFDFAVDNSLGKRTLSNKFTAYTKSNS